MPLGLGPWPLLAGSFQHQAQCLALGGLLCNSKHGLRLEGNQDENKPYK